ncbi:disulfide oxidoreductase [Arcobacter sp. LA11]|uniref:disulfide oxidoreductase n=1 Tax=Arcobacter sp. LA11 TaxID=1898176 RepID=UPI0009355153|nr:disulfide oxidoreductase [Arcobacter sp. LA11]
MDNKTMNSTLVFLSFLVASTATLGSLFFSEIMEFIPCSMCWYQRIFMYPLVLIFLINLLYPDDKIFKYSFPIVLVGLFFSIYHNLLMWGIIPESVVPCRQGVPCSTEYFEYFGFINIPFLSLLSYSLIFIFLIIGLKKGNNAK